MKHRTIYDLSEEEYERYKQGDPEFSDVTDNTHDDAFRQMGIDPYDD